MEQHSSEKLLTKQFLLLCLIDTSTQDVCNPLMHGRFSDPYFKVLCEGVKLDLKQIHMGIYNKKFWNVKNFPLLVLMVLGRKRPKTVISPFKILNPMLNFKKAWKWTHPALLILVWYPTRHMKKKILFYFIWFLGVPRVSKKYNIFLHGTHIILLLRTRCALVYKIGLSNAVIQNKLPITLYLCAPMSELPSYTIDI